MASVATKRRSTIGRATRVGGVCVLALLILMAVRTAAFTSRQLDPGTADTTPVNAERVAAHLSGALRYRTVSYQDRSLINSAEFEGFRVYLARTYPLVHSRLSVETVAGASLLFRWAGTDMQSAPILLMAHMDVVPVEPGTERLWKYPPFDGRIASGEVWGRGAVDDKLALIAILDSIEELLAAGFQPRRTVYLEFGHDEELGGIDGASNAAKLLASRGIHLDFVLDEGAMVLRRAIPGIRGPVALIGVAEKGYLTLELSASSPGGHASVPPPHTAAGAVSAAVAHLENDPMPSSFRGVTREMFGRLGPEMTVPKRLVFANFWLFGPLVKSEFEDDPKLNALIRTTTAVTMLEGSGKENVLPIRAAATVNFRILPGDTIASVTSHVREAIRDPQVRIRQVSGWEPSSVSDLDSTPGQVLQRTVRQIYPDAAAAPMLELGASDARHFRGISRNVYGFIPVISTPQVLQLAHGTGERVAVEDCGRAVRFYRRLLRNLAE